MENDKDSEGVKVGCIICHTIKKKNIMVYCTNEHPVHEECLEAWVLAGKLLSSDEIYCPLCHVAYSRDLADELFHVKQARRVEGERFSFELQLHEDNGTDGESGRWTNYARKLNLAQEAIEKFDFEIGLLHLFEILSKNPEDVQATFLFGIANFQRGNLVLAQHFFYKTIGLDPDHHLANIFLAEILLSQGKKPEAISLFKSARKALDAVLGKEGREKSEDYRLVVRRLKELTSVNYL